MNKVAIVDYATTKFRKSTDKSVYELACEPAMEILIFKNRSRYDRGSISFKLFK
jgi:acetyl-CoA acetyltransferase